MRAIMMSAVDLSSFLTLGSHTSEIVLAPREVGLRSTPIDGQYLYIPAFLHGNQHLENVVLVCWILRWHGCSCVVLNVMSLECESSIASF
ncbi:hypothetical protein F4680DRAFT_426944 [Xylaria scruposa]|nr:hypothetical protein F4680DRAFT_426944 [Xylaria scruposa]